jgi:hypothetical protein
MNELTNGPDHIELHLFLIFGKKKVFKHKVYSVRIRSEGKIGMLIVINYKRIQELNSEIMCKIWNSSQHQVFVCSCLFNYVVTCQASLLNIFIIKS